MAVVAFDETWDGRNASDSINNTADATRLFHLRTDNASDDQITVAAYVSAFPQFRLGAFHPNNPTIRITSRDFHQRTESPVNWIITLNYGRLLPIPGELAADGGSGGGGGNPEGEPNPLLRAPSYSFDTETFQEALEYDRSSPDPILIVNSAGEPLEGATAEQGRMIFTSVKNVATFNWRTVRRLYYTCNQGPYIPIPGGSNLFDPRELLLVHASAELVTEQFTYWRRTLRFRIANIDVLNEASWSSTKLVDRGFRQISTSAPTRSDGTPGYEMLTDNMGHPLTRPARLDGDGFQLSADAPDVLLEFTFYPAKDWGPIA